MRLRRNWQGEAALPEMPGVLRADGAPEDWDWSRIFERESPLHLEIGAGKGSFLTAMAAKYPRVNFVGIEKALTAVYIAAKKNLPRPLPNLRYLPADAEALAMYFRPGQVERIYLNFSDPWPKARHKARRLTAESKLSLYRRILRPGGQIHLKTDQEGFFAFSLDEFVRGGWSVGKITGDLYRSGFTDNVQTEYELRFIRMGQPIYRLEAWKEGEAAPR